MGGWMDGYTQRIFRLPSRLIKGPLIKTNCRRIFIQLCLKLQNIRGRIESTGALLIHVGTEENQVKCHKIIT
jgi:hypothetical protein